MKDRKFLIIIPAIIIVLLLTGLKFKKSSLKQNELSKRKKLTLIYNKLYNFKNHKQNQQHIQDYETKLLNKYNISEKEWNRFIYKLNNDKNYLKSYLDLLVSR